MIINMQVVVFYDKFCGKPEKISLDIQNLLGDDCQSQVLPIPPDAPLEIPRLILNYDDKVIALTGNSLSISTVNHRFDIINCVKLVLGRLGAFVFTRVGFVKTHFTNSGNISDLKQLVNQPIPVDNLSELRIIYNNTFECLGYNCNDHGDVFCGDAMVDNLPQPGILNIKDINTQYVSDVTLSVEVICNLLLAFNSRSDMIVELPGSVD